MAFVSLYRRPRLGSIRMMRFQVILGCADWTGVSARGRWCIVPGPPFRLFPGAWPTLASPSPWRLFLRFDPVFGQPRDVFAVLVINAPRLPARPGPGVIGAPRL